MSTLTAMVYLGIISVDITKRLKISYNLIYLNTLKILGGELRWKKCW